MRTARGAGRCWWQYKLLPGIPTSPAAAAAAAGRSQDQTNYIISKCAQLQIQRTHNPTPPHLATSSYLTPHQPEAVASEEEGNLGGLLT